MLSLFLGSVASRGSLDFGCPKGNGETHNKEPSKNDPEDIQAAALLGNLDG